MGARVVCWGGEKKVTAMRVAVRVCVMVFVMAFAMESGFCPHLNPSPGGRGADVWGEAV